MSPAVALACLALGLPDGAPGPTPAPPPAEAFAALGEEGTQDLVILGETGPVFLRLRVMIGERPFRAAWSEATRAFHGLLDRDGDGKVTPDEAEGAVPAPPPAPNPNGVVRQAPAPAEVDVNPKDGAVSFEELAEALRPAAGPFRLQADGPTGRRTDALFDHLDRDQDGRLTAPELSALVGSLRRLDRDDDELIGADEVASAGGAAPAAMTMMGRPARDPGVPAAVARVPGESPLRLTRLVMKKYDTGSSRGPGRPDSRLTPEEFAIPAPAFAAADTSHDGLLTSSELRDWIATAPPDAFVDVAFSADAKGPASVRVRGGDGGPPKGFTVQQLSEGVVELDFGVLRLDLHADGGAEGTDAALRSLHVQFNAADANQDGYLEATETTDQGDGAASPLAPLFRTLDRDRDGKLYPRELDEYVKRQAAGARGRLALTVSDQGRALFGLLDRDRDRRLGAREVLDTFARVSACDKDGDGRVAPEEVPHHVRLSLSRGDLGAPVAAGNGAGVVVASGAYPMTAEGPATRKAGPAWFRRMDRNRDGDVSRREFLGARPQFDRLDRDRDGLLGPDEAEAATPARVKAPGG